jgi:hypothetical protein
MAIGYGIAVPKGKTRKQLKARLDRAEAKVAAWCRAQCVARDGVCRVRRAAFVESYEAWISCGCDGPSEWAHMHVRRRSKTRGLDPTERHDPKYTLMLCRFHHQQYDAKRLVITAQTRKGANGGLTFRVKR